MGINQRHAGTIGAWADNRNESIRNGDNARRDQNGVALQALRNPGAVETLKHLTQGRHDGRRKIDHRQNIGGSQNPVAHTLQFGGGQIFRFRQNRARDKNLAEIHQRTGNLSGFDLDGG